MSASKHTWDTLPERHMQGAGDGEGDRAEATRHVTHHGRNSCFRTESTALGTLTWDPPLGG